MPESQHPIRAGRDIQAAPSPQPAHRQVGNRAMRAVLAILATSCLAVSGVGYATIGSINTDLASNNLQLGDGNKTASQRVKPADGAQDILLVGIDSRTDAQGNPLSQQEIDMLRAGEEVSENTDTIIVIRVPNDGSKATAISIPRDTYIRDEELGNTKINGVYGSYKLNKKEEMVSAGSSPDDPTVDEESKNAGRKALIRDVADLTGITVDHYAEVGLLGFVLLTNAVGGVDVCLNEAVDEPLSGAHFTAGEQTLNGPDALSFVRQRHDLPRGDLDRIVRQQVFMASLVHKILSSGTLTNPAKFTSLSDAARRSLTIDAGWNVMDLATEMSNLAGGNVTFNTIPVTSIDGVGDYGESVVTVDKGQVQAFFKSLLGNKEQAAATDAATTPTTTAAPIEGLQVHVLNASGTAGQAARAAAGLQQWGYQIGEIANAQAGLYNRSQVMTSNLQDEKAKELALRLELPLATSGSLNAGEVAVIVAADYDGPLAAAPAAESTTATAGTGEVVGTEGEAISEQSPTITAGGTGVRCVN